MTRPESTSTGAAAGSPPTRSALQSLLRLARAMLRQGRQLQLEHTAGSLAFLSLLAVVPMFSIVFAVTTASPAFERLREALQGFLLVNLFPAAISNTVIEHLNQFAAKANELSLIGTVAFLLTAFVALVTIERTLNRIWSADRPRPLANRFVLYWMLLTLGPLLLGAYLAIHGSVASAWLRGADLRELRSVWFIVLPWVTTVGGLMLLYRLLPSAAVRWREAFAGALLTALLVESLRALLGWYVTRLPTYTVVYGTFSALPVFLLWLFLGWMALLAGALLAANLRFWGQPGEPHLARAPSERFDDVHGVLATMRDALGGDRFGALPAQSLAPLLGHDPERAGQAALLLAELGYVTRFVSLGDARGAAAAPATRRARLALRLARRWSAARPVANSIWSERWAWADDPRTMTLRASFEAIWQAGRPAADDHRVFEAAFLDEPLVA